MEKKRRKTNKITLRINTGKKNFELLSLSRSSQQKKSNRRRRRRNNGASFERSKRLHNFSLPQLRWGQQRFLRCVNLPSPPPSSSSPDHAATNRSVSIAGVSLTRGGGGGAKNGEVVAAAKPWNLRMRRAACSEPGEEIEIGVNKRRSIIDNEDGGGDKKNEKSKFSIALSRDEIEQDFSFVFGKKTSQET
ncbi:hypothetical protein AtNW77_Chr1g0047701 [Arabidopsis thaliana]